MSSLCAKLCSTCYDESSGWDETDATCFVRWQSTKLPCLTHTSKYTPTTLVSKSNTIRKSTFHSLKSSHPQLTYIFRPYVKGLPIKLTIQSQLPSGDFSEQIIRPTYVDPYVLEMQQLYEAIVLEKEYKTTPLDAKNDIILAQMIMGALVD